MIGTLRKLQKLISKFPAKPGLPTAPQHSTSKARAPHSPPAQYQQSQGSPQPPSTVSVKPGLPTAPQHSTSEARAPHSPSTVPAKPGLPTAPQHSTSKARAPHSPQHSTSEARAPHSPPAQYQQSQGSPQPPSTVPATRDHHRDCLPLPSARRGSQPPGTITRTVCLSPVPEEAPSHHGPPQGLPVISEHSLDIYTFKLETS